MRIRGRARRRHPGPLAVAEVEAMLTAEINEQMLDRIEGRYVGTLPNGYFYDVTLYDVTLDNNITYDDLTIK